MTSIQCNQQYCEFNKHEICTKKHITLCNIKDISQHFWFACFDYSGDQPPNKPLKSENHKNDPECNFCGGKHFDFECPY